MSEEQEITKGGSTVYRYADQQVQFSVPETEAESLAEIEAHLAKYVGNPATVYHELVSSHIHIDVHIVEPTAARNYYTLITSGMSDKPMNAPFAECKYAELMVCLPPHWKLKENELEDYNNYWIIEWLKKLARFPHQYNTWLWATHTIPNGDPPRPFASNTNFSGILVAPPILFAPEFITLPINDEKTINFHGLIPIYQEEMQFKLDQGVDALFDKFDQNAVSELLDLNRKNVCRKKLFGIF